MSSEVLKINISWGIAQLIINRPEQRNSLSEELIKELIDAFESCDKNPLVRVIELTATGNRAFCAGGDLLDHSSDRSCINIYERSKLFAKLLLLMQNIGKPILAVVQGHAMGGGFGLAMASDFVIAVDTAVFATPEIHVGLFPMIIMAVLSKNIPQKKLKELMFFGEKVSAKEAYEIGFINKVVSNDELRNSADEYLRKLLQKSPAIMKLGKKAFYRMSDMPMDSALEFLATQLTINSLSDDTMEGIMAFIEKRSPEWKSF